MRQWLDDHSLPQSVADALLTLGVRSIEDVRMFVRECPERLSGLAPLDQVKLKKSVAALEDGNEIVTWNRKSIKKEYN